MSSLGALITGRATPGVYRWDTPLPAQEVRGAVEEAGWTFALLDGLAHPDRTSVLRALGAALGFPSYYGANLDALEECLGELAASTVLLWDVWGPLAYDDPETFAALLDVFTARAARDPRFVVLLTGRGPEVDLPVLA